MAGPGAPADADSLAGAGTLFDPAMRPEPAPAPRVETVGDATTPPGQTTADTAALAVAVPVAVVVPRFVPDPEMVLAPSGGKARYQANVAAIRLVRDLADQGRPASVEEQRVLARWSSWGAIPDVFDETKTGWERERDELRGLLTDVEWDAAARTTINAHYTDPAYAAVIWKALHGLGFTGGDVLEPGSGAGTFIGLAPETARMVGVELDPVTASIARALYPHADVRAESFADTRLPEGVFDATVGNVPFSSVRLHDPVHNPTRQSMHNHFILKSLALTRPGGLVAVLTSRYTMDSQNPGARRAMNDLADLVGAVRLPTGAHRRAAGTEAVTDLLILRRREPDQAPVDDSWETVTPIVIDGEQVRINTYFDHHPDHILGTVGVGHGMHGRTTLTVTTDLDTVGEQLQAALDGIVFTARRTGLTMTPRATAPEVAAGRVANDPAPAQAWDGTIIARPDGTFATVAGAHLEPLQVPKTAARELAALVGLRDDATALLRLEAATVDETDDITKARANLRRDYLAYLARYGPINRYTLRPTGRTNEVGEETFARMVPTPIRLLRADPFGPLVIALEQFDETNQTATPAPLLTRRVVAPRTEIQGVDTAAEAVAVSMDRTGRVDLPLVADLLGMGEPEARAALDGLVFTDPHTGTLIQAPEYLSGDVREKLATATEAATTNPAFAVNVEALRAVLPEPLGVEDITAKMGAVWISAQIHQQFLRDILHTADVRVENLLPGMWEVRGGRTGLRATSEWGTQRRPAPDIAQAVMEQRPLVVQDEVEDVDGKKRLVLNAVETTAAQEKADAMGERFAEWVWEDPARAASLVAEYNNRFNNLVLRDYTKAGDYLTLPGMAASFTPRPHQRAAVARMIAEPAALLAHEVGAGKTAEMVMGGMEMRRMGLIRKPVIVVPNHMLEQFGREWLQIYPQARILAASSADLTADRRRLFVARAAANDWDGIILTQGAFAKIPLRPETQAAYIGREMDKVREVLHQARGADRMSVKRIERKLLGMENKLKARTDTKKDVGVCFEDTGIDYVIVDEMHMFKNLATESNIQGAAIEGAERATDLHMKLEYLRSLGRDRVVTGATATPISNSVTEAYVMQKYLRPDLLIKAGIGEFDAWAATFGQTVTQMEMAPTGDNTFRLKTRFAKFSNVPEMLRLWSTFADVKTGADLNLPTPALAVRADGRRLPDTTVVQPTVELEQFIERIGERATRVAAKLVDPRDDNMLTISTDARKAALDIRLVAPTNPSGPTKVDVAADTIHAVWEATRDNTYLDTITGQPSDVPGGLQLVFCDLGTPSREHWNVYDQLKASLVGRGMPPGSVRFMHEAKTDVDKARLFAAARAGHIAVLVGSTEKMGVGTNVQARAVALYHLDCPWRPSDIAQREGRILRQGNQNDQVSIVRIVTERSFDAYMWQGVERKATFIAQLMRGRLDTREIEEIDSATLSAAEAKAISSGNHLLLEQATVKSDVQRLRRLERAHQRNESMLKHTAGQAAHAATRAKTDIDGLERALPRLTDTTGDKFTITIQGHQYDSRTDAAAAITRWATNQNIQYASAYQHRDYGTIGSISGYPITIELQPGISGPEIHLGLDGVPRTRFLMTKDTFLQGGVGLIQRIENRASGIPTLLDQARADLERATREETEARERIGKPFKHATALDDAVRELASIEARLTGKPGPTPSPDRPAAPDPNTPTREGAEHETAERETPERETPERETPVHKSAVRETAHEGTASDVESAALVEPGADTPSTATTSTPPPTIPVPVDTANVNRASEDTASVDRVRINTAPAPGFDPAQVSVPGEPTTGPGTAVGDGLTVEKLRSYQPSFTTRTPAGPLPLVTPAPNTSPPVTANPTSGAPSPFDHSAPRPGADRRGPGL